MFSNRMVSNNNTNTTTDPYFKNTIFLLHADGTNGANNTTYVDNSNYGGIISRGALLNSQGSFSPYNPAGYSMFFNGISDYLNYTATNAGTIGTGDFTVELWTWINTAPVLNAILFTIGNTNGVGSLSVFSTTTSLYVRINSNLDTIISALPVINQWTHVAVVRISGVINVYYNGVVQNKSSSTSPGTAITGTNCWLAYDQANALWPAGYISNFRIVVGTGVYTGAFTPPTTQLANIQPSGSNISAVTSGTVTLLNYNRFYDASVYDYQVTVYGSPIITPFTPFTVNTTYSPSLHGGSIYHASATDWVGTTTAVIATANSWPQLGLGGEDFSIEFWAYPLTNTSTNQYFFSNYSADTNERGLRLGVSSSTGVVANIYLGTTNSIVNSITRPIYANSWTHVAVARKNSTIKIFQNGQIVGSSPDTYTYNIPAFTVASASYARTTATVGYTSDVRIVRGSTAYFDNNFTPPTAALSLYATEVISNRTVVQMTGFTPYIPTVAINGINVYNGFCLEFWFNVSTLVPGGFEFFGHSGQNNTLAINLSSVYGINISNAGYYGLGTQFAGQVVTNTWQHIALIGTGGYNYVALNGIVANTFAAGGSAGYTNNGAWQFINPGFNYTGAHGVAYVRDYRLTTGSPVYSINGFTPPNSTPGLSVTGGTVRLLTFTDSGVTDLTGNGTVDTTYVTVGINLGGRGSSMYNNYNFNISNNNTVLLLNGSNGSLIDATGRNNITYGVAGGAVIPAINTTTRKFGTGAVGAMAAGFMRIPNSPLWDFGSGDFMIDFWFYPTSVTVLQTIYSKKVAAANFGPVQTNISTTGKVQTLLSANGTAYTHSMTSVVSVPISTWNYIAVYRSGTSLIQNTILANSFVDTQANTIVSGTSLISNTADFTIGNQSNAASQPMLGYVDEFRVTKGTSRGYGASPNLPPLPTTAFPNQ